MKNFERIFFGLVLGFAFPFLCSLLAMMIWFYAGKNEIYAPYSLLAGFLVGVLIDLLFLKKWITQRYNLSIGFILTIYLLYNIGLYGMFMGFPVFNILMGNIAGYYFGKRIGYNNLPIERQPALINRVAFFSAFIMAVICISSAVLALTEKTLASNLKGMLGLHFEITHGIIIGLIISGGIFLVTMQFIITKITILKTLKF